MYRYDTAKNEAEKREVLPLIKRIYEEQGYSPGDSNPNPFEKYLLKPENQVFKGYVDDTLFATISLVIDSDLGLPIDSLYKAELQPLRDRKEKLAEVTQFAVDHSILKKTVDNLSQLKQLMASVPLLKLVLDHAIKHNIDKLCIAINPKHDDFYKSLGFTPIGELKYYASVNNAPALARVLDVSTLDKNNLPGIFR